MYVEIRPGCETWRARTSVPRHCHAGAYADVVLSGGFEESGSSGRFRVRAGDVLIHDRFHAHLNRFERHDTRILSFILPLAVAFPLGRVADVDAIARLSERDAPAVAELVGEQLAERPAPEEDWPDLLAKAMLADPSLRLDRWADAHGLSAETLSRGFGRVFATTPAAFRAEVRARKAFVRITETAAPLAEIAAEAGFADQAHMTRSIRALTGVPPRLWRSNPFKTEIARTG
ncbi:helix-turn-helix transcriptional regulator [Rhodanobacter sp. DHG33]|uniref:helix-turn-helix domain-containing protein n=1 Tax=Rhodanobacter sp. DHG33 TaxID=2775921 RepID=UPI00177BBD32|nr:helix-turn-helix transcriptional regulator [Rhodanobacter sp. DHG33]MBD8899547.1 helix-turn-helix transcriptional regulator [Rhodanobacter sp. DHG33]